MKASWIKRLLVALLAILGVVLLLVLIIIYWFSDPVSKYKNIPRTKITELSWKEGLYKIYYIGLFDKKLYSQNSDGTNKKLIYDNPEISEYYLTPDKKIIIITKDNQLFLLDEDGKYLKAITQFPKEHFISQLRVSSDGKLIAVEIFVHERGTNVSTSFSDVYIINIDSGKSQKLDREKHLLGSKIPDYIAWFKDNNRLLFVTTTEEPYFVEYLIYGLIQDETKLLGRHETTIKKDVSKFVDEAELVKTEPTYYSETYFSSVSPDKTKLAEIKEGNIFIDSEEVMHWHGYDAKFNRGCSHPNWLPDNEHLVVSPQQSECGIRIIEASTKKVAMLDEGINPKWFGRVVDSPDSSI